MGEWLMKLNIGGQQSKYGVVDGWTCVDLLPGADIVMDIQEEELPIVDKFIEAIYFSHCLEHLWPHKYDYVLGEMYRVLLPGGILRVVVPDMSLALRKYQNQELADSNPHHIRACLKWWFDYGIDEHGTVCLNHLGGFDGPYLHHVLERNNFTCIERKAYGKHSQVFVGCDNPDHEDTSLYMEAHKP